MNTMNVNLLSRHFRPTHRISRLLRPANAPLVKRPQYRTIAIKDVEDLTIDEGETTEADEEEHESEENYVHQELSDAEDPNMNGGYINPPAIPRQFRDPYADWWDKQERRNYGEPLHEDNDIMGMFSPERYTHFTPGKSFFLFGCFVTTFLGFVGVVRNYYPDKPSIHRGFEGGLDRELGGEGAVHARIEDGID